MLSVDASAVSGGLLILYDVVDADKSGLWSKLQSLLAAHGLREPDQHQRAQSGALARAAPPGNVADKVVGAVVEKLVERSALALVAALL